MKQKKPTMNEVKEAISIILKRLDDLYNVVQQTNVTFTEYILFQKTGDEFTKHLKEKFEKNKEDNDAK